MNRRVFETYLTELKAHIMASAAEFFAERNMNFDPKRMEKHGAEAIDGLARDFFFTGADATPSD